MPFEIVRNDILKMEVDAIVNPTDKYFSGSGGLDAKIHYAAGPALSAACSRLGQCKVGSSKITSGYGLPCKYIIHTVGPVWRGGWCGERTKLESCYRTCLELALEYGCESIAFPIISSGTFGYPKEKAIEIANAVISEFLDRHDMMIYLVTFDKLAYYISKDLFSAVQSYIDDNYVKASDADQTSELFYEQRSLDYPCATQDDDLAEYCTKESSPFSQQFPKPSPRSKKPFPSPAVSPPLLAMRPKELSLDEALNHIDESFSQMVLRKIREKGMKNSECYKKANLDKKLFSKLVNDIHYRPKKTTALALAIALHLSLSETSELLMKAGFSLSHSEKFDIIVEYFIKTGNYDIFQINEVLFSYDQPLLGSIIY